MPLYLQIANLLKEGIVGGAYPVGSLLPTEDALCERFGVSRFTVREALRLLREDGLVSSRRGAGTIVIPPRDSGTDTHQVMSISDLVNYAKETRFDIDSIKTVVIDSKLARHTGLSCGDEWLEVTGFRCAPASDEVLCATMYYIHREFANVARLLRRHEGPIFPLIEDLFGQRIGEVRQQISATLMNATLAARLKVKAGSAALVARRSYVMTDDRVGQVTINTHPADRFQHSMVMRRIQSEKATGVNQSILNT